MKAIRWGVVLVALTACKGVGVGGSTAVETVPFVNADGEFVYSAKYLCGTIYSVDDSTRLPDRIRDTAAVLVPGLYLTSVNIQNPWTSPVSFMKSMVEIKGQREARGLVAPVGVDSLEAGEGLEVDCWDIISRLKRAHRLADGFVEGFVWLRSKQQLQVTGVYSYRSVEVE